MEHDTVFMMRLRLDKLKQRRDELSDEIIRSTSNYDLLMELLSEQREIMLEVYTISIKLENIRLRKPMHGINENSNIKPL